MNDTNSDNSNDTIAPAGDEASTRSHSTLPVLTLTSGVVLPQMVLTVALETDEATAAVEAALAGEAKGGNGHVLLVPRIGETHSSVGTIAKIDQAGELPGGMVSPMRVWESKSI